VHTVRVTLPGWDVNPKMAEMRRWLEANGFEPALFKYRITAAGAATVDVKFISPGEAEAFAAEFHGTVISVVG
jgi:hypothetical protein